MRLDTHWQLTGAKKTTLDLRFNQYDDLLHLNSSWILTHIVSSISQISTIQPKNIIASIIIPAASVTNTFAMSTTRYAVALPESTIVLETRQQLNAWQSNIPSEP